MNVLVVGGTGMLGRLAVEALQERGGVHVRVFSRGKSLEAGGVSLPADVQCIQGDLISGEGLEHALHGTGAVIWCTHDRQALANDALGMRNLLAACAKAGVRHIVYTGISGIETSAASSYYAGKLREEQLIAAGDIPFSILRATQFHTLVVSVLESLRDGNLLRVPENLMLRPVAPLTAAQHLVNIALSAPLGRTVDLAGPEDIEMRTAARQWLAARGLVLEIETIRAAPERWAMLQTLTHGPARREGSTFRQWLETGTHSA